jgi:hypothetical protein
MEDAKIECGKQLNGCAFISIDVCHQRHLSLNKRTLKKDNDKERQRQRKITTSHPKESAATPQPHKPGEAVSCTKQRKNYSLSAYQNTLYKERSTRM